QRGEKSTWRRYDSHETVLGGDLHVVNADPITPTQLAFFANAMQTTAVSKDDRGKFFEIGTNAGVALRGFKIETLLNMCLTTYSNPRPLLLIFLGIVEIGISSYQ
ncbi:hypothetical protein PFISCL1PPCAC_15614, partial [Pristionchus fissidentatus]